MKKFVYAIAIIALSVSSCQDLTVERSNNGTIKIGKVVISNGNNIVTKASSGTNVTNNGDIIVEESINPSETPLTKASEISTLGDFYLEGYLDSSIMDKVAASDADKRDQHFIKSALVEKGENGWTIAGAPVWRNFVEHYFWAYAGSEIELQPVVENDYTKMSFSYDAQANDGDLIVAYTSQGGEVDHSDHAASAEDNYIKNLVFNHALAEIVIDPSALTPVEEVVSKKDRTLTVSASLPKVFSSAECEVSSTGFDWSVSGSGDKMDIQSKVPTFIIPQSKSSDIVLTVVDDLTGVSTQRIVPLSGEWENGKRYKYVLSGNYKVPNYYPDDDDPSREGFHFNATGIVKASELIGDIQAQYIKSINIEWVGVPYAEEGNGTYLVLYLAASKSPLSAEELMTKPVENNVVFGCKISKNSWNVYPAGIISKPTKDSAPNTAILLENIQLPFDGSNPNQIYSLFAAYAGGANGGGNKHDDSKLDLKGLKVTIAERRY